MRFGVGLILVLFYSTALQAQQAGSNPELPSADMLEFLGDLEPIDEETWQILEHHALQDVTQKKEVNSE